MDQAAPQGPTQHTQNAPRHPPITPQLALVGLRVPQGAPGRPKTPLETVQEALRAALDACQCISGRL